MVNCSFPCSRSRYTRIEAVEGKMMEMLFHLFGTLKREGDWYIAHCPPLDITTQGKTITEARKNLIEASELFVISCVERGTLDRAMKELGFVPLKGTHLTPQRLGPNEFKVPISIPLRLQKRLQNNLQCRG
jgi:predicted RNase H-like HicB family nuclease